MLFCLSGASAVASTVNYHPDSQARLGYGYNPNTPEIIYAVGALDSDGPENIDTTDGVVQLSTEVMEVTDRKTLLRSLGVSASIEARAGFYSGSSSFSQSVGASFNSDSIVWSATAKVNFGRYRLKNPRPSKSLAESPTPKDVLTRFGSEVFVQETRGAVASVIFEASNLSQTQKQALSAALSASSSNPTLSGSASAGYQSAVEQVQRSSRLRVFVFVQGGPGASALSPILTNPGDLTLIRETLAAYLTQTTPGNSKPLVYETSPIIQFKDAKVTVVPDVQQDRLWEIYQQYMNLTDLIRRIDDLIKPTSEADKYLQTFVSDVKRSELNKVRDLYDSARSEYRRAGLACMSGNIDYKLPDAASLPRVDWPLISEAPYAIGWELTSVPFLAVVGSPPPNKGDVVASAHYTIGLTGKADLFSKASLIDGQNPVPLKVTPVKPLRRLASLNLPGESTVTRAVDEAKLFGVVFIPRQIRYQLEESARIEVEDIFGRKTVYRLSEF